MFAPTPPRDRSDMPAKDKVLIANGQGFWGDSILGPVRLVNEGPLDYLTLDYLAEVTMSIMQKLKSRKPEMGYATDFVTLIDRVLPQLVEKDIKVIANAGGVNPHACKDAVLEVIKKHGVEGVKVAVVEGDDILGDLDDLMAQGEELRNMDTGEPLSTVRDRVSSANVYLGAFPIAEALDQGAQIVITGRGTDPGLVIGPLIHEFGWKQDDYDKIAAGTVAGHIVECGAQCTGGNYTDWRNVPDLARIGYPDRGGAQPTAVLRRSRSTTGRAGIVTEDLGHATSSSTRWAIRPRTTSRPDCVGRLHQRHSSPKTGEDRVRGHGGEAVRPADRRPTRSRSAITTGGRRRASSPISGPDALEKARLCARKSSGSGWPSDGFDYSARTSGWRSTSAPASATPASRLAPRPTIPAEVVLRMGVRRTPTATRVDPLRPASWCRSSPRGPPGSHRVSPAGARRRRRSSASGRLWSRKHLVTPTNVEVFTS